MRYKKLSPVFVIGSNPRLTLVFLTEKEHDFLRRVNNLIDELGHEKEYIELCDSIIKEGRKRFVNYYKWLPFTKKELINTK